MDPITTQWVIGLVALFVGFGAGLLFARKGANPEREQELNDQVLQSKKELDEYREQVNQHFEQTAALVNQLTESYRQVHQHLAGGAQQLANPEKVTTQLSSPDEALALEEQTTAPETPAVEQDNTDETGKKDVEAPKDYAPKRTPEEAGTLSESYGLKSESKPVEEPRGAGA